MHYYQRATLPTGLEKIMFLKKIKKIGFFKI